MLFVDPWHWLDVNGNVPRDHPQLRPKVLRLANFIQSSADLSPGWARTTLVECKKRPAGQRCQGLMVVTLLDDDRILAFCPVCLEEEAMIQNWRTTPWGKGLPKAVKPSTLNQSRLE